MIVIKNPANMITSSRIVFAIGMLVVPSFSALFWVCYVCAAVSDAIDGLVARKLNQQSDFGAKLDSIADLVFAFAVAVIILMNVELPDWLWIGIVGIGFLRLTGYGIGYLKFHQFSSLHTYANKVTGGSLFLFPMLFYLWGIEISGMILCALAFASATEEVIIIIKAKELNRDCKGLFIKS